MPRSPPGETPADACGVDRSVPPARLPDLPPLSLLALAGDRLRQPLYALNLFAGSLGRDASPQQGAALRGLEDSLRDLARAVDDLEQTAGLLQDPVPVERVVLASAPLLERVAGACTPGDVAVRWRTRDLSIHGDARLTTRLLQALVDDAARRTRTRVLLTARRAGDGVRVEIRDDGDALAASPPSDALIVLANQAGREGAHDHVLALAVAARLAALFGLAVTLRPGSTTGNAVSVLFPAPAPAPGSPGG